jgi:hypothetical protein
MAATVTDTLKYDLAKKFLDDLQNANDSNEYYIGIGRPIEYSSDDTPISPNRTRYEEREARNNLLAIKKISSNSFVIPRYNWTSGTVYTSWDDNVVGIPSNSFYVLTEDQEVYICLQQGKTAGGTSTPSTVKPSYSAANVAQYEAFETADGYRWKFMYSISATRAAAFLTTSYMPTQQIPFDSNGLDTFELQQLDIQKRAIGGRIIGFTKVSGGTGFNTVPNVNITGNGSGAKATATISGGAVVKIEMNDESASLGSGYDYASVTISGGGGVGASFRPIITPENGLEYNAPFSMKSSNVMMNTKPSGTEDGNFFIDQDFRQITVIKNITVADSDARYTATSAKVPRFVRMNSPVAFTADDIIRDSTGGSAAFVVGVDSDKVYYIQNERTGFRSFENNMFIEDSDGALNGTIDSAGLLAPVNPHSGELLYIENRARVVRSTSQTEDIKVIISV